jgi:hypothetical protein
MFAFRSLIGRQLLQPLKSWVQPPMPHIAPSNFIQIRELASKKHKKIIKLAKGYRGRANRVYSVAFHRVLKAQQYAYRDRKV